MVSTRVHPDFRHIPRSLRIRPINWPARRPVLVLLLPRRHDAPCWLGVPSPVVLKHPVKRFARDVAVRRSYNVAQADPYEHTAEITQSSPTFGKATNTRLELCRLLNYVPVLSGSLATGQQDLSPAPGASGEPARSFRLQGRALGCALTKGAPHVG